MKIVFIFLFPSILFASDFDNRLRKYFKDFLIKSPTKLSNENPELFSFGEKLFKDKDLSLNKNIACISCHSPSLGTGDGLPLGIGEGGVFREDNVRQGEGDILPRNTPHLFNKAHPSFRALFWDGRVSLNQRTGVFKTPEPGLNGDYPEYYFITDKIDSLIAMQALFPLVNKKEMRGKNYNHLSNLSIWRLLAERIKTKNVYKKYINEGFNIADIANALGYYQKIAFQVNDTPMDRYIMGKNDALSINEKKGALVFFEQGRCARCHFGPLMSNRSFQSVAAPQIGPGMSPKKNDKGRFLVTKNSNDKYWTSPKSV